MSAPQNRALADEFERRYMKFSQEVAALAHRSTGRFRHAFILIFDCPVHGWHAQVCVDEHWVAKHPAHRRLREWVLSGKNRRLLYRRATRKALAALRSD